VNTDDERRRVIEKAIALKARDDAWRTDDPRSLEAAAAELGITSDQLREAQATLARDQALDAERRLSRRRWLIRGGGAALAIAAGVGIWAAVRPAPPEPWTADFSAGTWQLDVSAGTVARLNVVAEGGVTVADVTVESVAPRGDGTWFVNLDGTGLPAIAGHQSVSVTLGGTLPNARLYLEAGQDERWRSPPIAVPRSPERRTLPLAAFEHQTREGGKWTTASGSAPTRIDTISWKFGHFVNPPGAAGSVRLGALHLE
jgi:hypothetical protein